MQIQNIFNRFISESYSDLYIFMLRYLIRLLLTCFMTLLYKSEHMVPKGTQMVQKYAKHTGSYSCTFYSRLPRLRTMNEMDTVHQEPEGMVQY